MDAVREAEWLRNLQFGGTIYQLPLLDSVCLMRALLARCCSELLLETGWLKLVFTHSGPFTAEVHPMFAVDESRSSFSRRTHHLMGWATVEQSPLPGVAKGANVSLLLPCGHAEIKTVTSAYLMLGRVGISSSPKGQMDLVSV